MRNYVRRLRVWESNYGRESGWLVVRRDEVIAILTNPRWEDTFWYSYQMEIVTADPLLRDRLQTQEFWASTESQELVWRSREFSEEAIGAFPALSPFPEPGRLMMRRLYLPIGKTWLWDRLVLWCRRRQRRRAQP